MAVADIVAGRTGWTAHAASRLRALGTRFVAERNRWPLWLPVFLGSGIALYFSLSFEPPGWAAALAVALAGAALMLGRTRPVLLLVAVPVAAISVGFAAAKLAAINASAPVLEKRVGPVVVEGRVLEVDMLPEGRRVVMTPRRLGRDDEGLPARIRLRVTKGEGLSPGDWFQVRAIVLPPPPPAMPGAFDFQRQAYFDRLGGVGYAIGPAIRIEPPPGRGPAGWRVAIAQLRHAMTERIIAVLPGGTGGVAAALITGEMGPIPAEVNQAFRDSGLAHLLSISGIHMSLV